MTIDLAANLRSRLWLSLAGLSLGATTLPWWQASLIALALLPLLLVTGQAHRMWRFGRLVLAPVFIVYALAWGLIVQAGPGQAPGTSVSAGMMHAIAFSLRIAMLGELAILLWGSLSPRDLIALLGRQLPFADDKAATPPPGSARHQAQVMVAIAVFSYHFLISEVQQTVQALAARGELRRHSLLDRFRAVPVVMSNLWISSLRTAIRRAHLKWIPQSTLSRAVWQDTKYATSKRHSLLLNALALSFSASVLIHVM